jgi:hypothetical protein
MTELKRYKVFYCFYGTGKSVDADHPVEMHEADIYSEMLGGLEEQDDFFGLIDSSGTTLQVMYDKEHDRFWIEIPAPDEGGAYGQYLSFDDITDQFKNLPAIFSRASFPAFTFQSWA